MKLSSAPWIPLPAEVSIVLVSARRLITAG